MGATLLACTSSDASPPLTQAGTASLTIGLAGAKFVGGSVSICGARVMEPSSRAFCDASLPAEPCPCYEFNADGTGLVDANGDPLVINGLCPSNLEPVSDWRFRYVLYDQPGCTGNPLNGENGFFCYDSRDLRTQSAASQSIEPLNVGLNTNHIVCAIENTAKSFAFGACTVTTNDADIALMRDRYDCGCEPAGDECLCGAGVPPISDFEPACELDHVTCEVVCRPPKPFPCTAPGPGMTPNMYWGTGSAFFDQMGTLYLYGSPAYNSSDTRQNSLYAVDLTTGELTFPVHSSPE